jgi:hypothetical protein
MAVIIDQYVAKEVGVQHRLIVAKKRIGLDYLHNIFIKQTLCQYHLVGCCDIRLHHLSQKNGVL